ncbi:MAG: PAS domain-containing protein [Burkholderiales bacterium]|nr:PAS domain-containing protein [Burkholderiales bacterium]
MEKIPDFHRRLLAKQVNELFVFAPAAVAFSFIGSIVTVVVFYDTGELQKGLFWFLFATLVMFFRAVVAFGYRQQAKPVARPEDWARLMIVGNIFAGIQWGLLGTVLFPAEHNYRELFTVLVLTSYVAGSITAFSPVKWAHLAMAIPASLPSAIYIFWMRDGMNWLGGGMALFFIFCVLFFSYKQHEIVACRLKVELENEELLARSLETSSSLSVSNNELKTRTEIEQRAKLEAKARADQLGAHVSRTLLPIAECDRNLNVIEWNAAAEATLGYRHKDVRGQHLTSLLLPAENQLAGKPAIEKLLREDRASTIDIPLQTSRGQRIPMHLFFTPIQSADGVPTRVAVIMMKA